MNDTRLARVRRVRELQERALRAEWASAERAANDAKDIVTRLADLRNGSGLELARRVVVGNVDVQQMLLDGDSLDRLDAAVVAASARARDARRHADLRRAPWQERRTEAEGIRRIEARQLAQRRAEEFAREQAIQDEQAGMRHARGPGERALEQELECGGRSVDSVERVRNDE